MPLQALYKFLIFLFEAIISNELMYKNQTAKQNIRKNDSGNANAITQPANGGKLNGRDR
ncbi:hypothetical protein [Hydrococcus rivularis]|uniref:hypothetical protein n=1 Tax=Hydrococcus rivularis TaxID=1616834 RepID=UPI000AE193BF|nr:hypothetical protein [Hydrococcus rivularis]